MTEVPSTRPSLLVRLRDFEDRHAWHEFVDLYAPVVFGYARSRGLQNADAADLTQEVLSQVAEAIMEVLKPDGVAVVIEAEHLCMTMRGVKKPGSRMVTSAMRGDFKQSAVTRGEFLSLVHGQH
jgi:GTP cyclohydrolase I